MIARSSARWRRCRLHPAIHDALVGGLIVIQHFLEKSSLLFQDLLWCAAFCEMARKVQVGPAASPDESDHLNVGLRQGACVAIGLTVRSEAPELLHQLLELLYRCGRRPTEHLRCHSF